MSAGSSFSAVAVDLSNDQDIDGVLWGYKWSQTNLTFSFPTTVADYTNSGYPTVNGFLALTSVQIAAERTALADFSAVCGLTFTETTGAGANLRFAECTSYDSGDGQGVHIPGNGAGTAEANPVDPANAKGAWGDAWFSYGETPAGNDNSNPQLGNFIFTAAFMHELGHNLGLKHGHQTQTAHGVDLPTLPDDHDSQEYSIMTYDTYPNVTPSKTNNVGTNQYPETPMMDDISALQYLYGANYTTHSGATVYKWDPTTGQESISEAGGAFVGQGVPYQNHILETIWDGGGTDTYDLSNYTTNIVANLNPGEWINLNTELADLDTNHPGTHLARGNIANAREYNGNAASLIENFIGGSGNDVITGNGANNALFGGNGNDTIDGGLGADSLTGGSGANTFIYKQGYGADIITDFTPGSGDKIDISTFRGYASLADVERNATDLGADMRIDFGSGSLLTLDGINKSGLTAGSFNYGAAIVYTWSPGVSGNWFSAGWNQDQGSGFYGTPSAGTVADISAAGQSGAYTVTVTNVHYVVTGHSDVDYVSWETGSLILGASATLATYSTYFNLDSGMTGAGTLLVADTLTMGPKTNAAGAVVTLTAGSGGPGFVTLSDQTTSAIVGADPTVVLKNEGDSIRGGGTISNLVFVNENGGTVNATSASAQLVINNVGALTNYATLKSTASAGLVLGGVINQQQNANVAGTGVIKAVGAGARVYLRSSTRIVGGQISSASGGVVMTGGSGAAGAGAAVVLDGNAAGITGVVNSGALEVIDNSALTLLGNFSNSGTLTVDSPYYGTALYIDAAGAFVSGAGSIVLATSARMLGNATSGSSLLQNSSNIVGAGSLGGGDGTLSVINRGAGVINSTAGLTVDTQLNTLQNFGLMEATTGVLTIRTKTISQASGTIMSNGSAVVLVAVTVQGGTIASKSVQTQVQTSGAVTYDGTGSQMQLTGYTDVIDNSSLTLKGAINNASTGGITLESPYYGSSLLIDAVGVTLTGHGSIYNRGSLIDATSGSASSTLSNTDNLIFGEGQIGSGTGKLHIVNQSRILALDDFLNDSQALTLNTGNTIVNAGLIEAGSTGGLTIRNSTVQNVSSSGTGSVQASGSSFVTLYGATVIGGTLQGNGTTGYFTVSTTATLDGTGSTPVTINGLVKVPDSDGLTLLGSIVNKGTIALTGSYYQASLNTGAGSATLTGAGTITAVGGANNLVGTFTNVNNTFAGSFVIGDGVVFTNQQAGVLNASDSFAMAIGTSTTALSNAGLIESTGTGGLQLRYATITDTSTAHIDLIGTGGASFFASTIDDNAGARIDVRTGSSLGLQSSTIKGGTVAVAGTGAITVHDGVSTLDGSTTAVALSGKVNIVDAGNLTLNRVTATAAAIVMTGSYYQAGITLKGTGATLAGGSTVSMTGGANYINGAAGSTLTVSASTIAGGGTIGDGSAGVRLTINGDGIVNASDTTAMVFNTATVGVSNAGLIETTGVGALQITGSTIVGTNTGRIDIGGTGASSTFNAVIDDTAGARIDVRTGASFTLQSSIVKGGAIAAAGTGALTVTNGASTLDGSATAVTLSGKVNILDSGNLTLNRVTTTAATITMTGSYYQAGLRVIGSGATLAGGSLLTMSGGANFITGAAGSTLTVSGSTISGGGAIGDNSSGIKLVNNADGIINGSDATTQFLIQTFSQSVTNKGLIEATGTSGLRIATSTIDQTGGGVLKATAGSHVELATATIQGGTMTAVGTGYFAVTDRSSVLAGGAGAGALALTGQMRITEGSSLTLLGTIANAGSVVLSGTYYGAGLIASGATLTGGGTVTMTGGANAITGLTGSTLDNVNNTISGYGQIGAGIATLTNEAAGVVNATGGLMEINAGSGAVNNSGLLQASAGGTLAIESGLANSGTIKADGGRVTVTGAVTGSGGAAIDHGGTLDLEADFGETTSFLATSGTLLLGRSVAGKVANFVQGDTIDLRFVAFGGAALSYAANGGGGTLTVPGSNATAAVNFAGFYGASLFRLADDTFGGTLLTLAGGTVTNSATTTIAGTVIPGGETLQNTGTIVTTGNIQIGDGSALAAHLVNQTGGTVSLSGDIGVTIGTNTTSNINNAGGTLQKTSGTGISGVAANVINSTGAAAQIKVASGTLNFTGASNSFVNQTISGAGTFAIGGGGVSTISGGTTITTAAWTIGKVGTTVNLGQNLTYGGSFSNTNQTVLNLGANTLTLSGAATFNLGVVGSPIIAGTGKLITSGTDTLGAFTLGGSVLFRSNGTVNQIGTITLGDSSGGAAQFTNAPGKSWSIQGDYSIVAGNTAAVFNNGGATLTKASGTGTSAIGTNFVNLAGTAATISIASGILNFTGATNSFVADAISGAGTFAIGGGGTSTIGAGTSITTASWTIAKVGTAVTLGENLAYAGNFSQTNQTTLNLGANTLTLSGPALFNLGPGGSPIIAGTGKLITNGADSLGAFTLGGSVLLRNNGGVTQTGTITLGDSTNGPAQVTNAAGKSWVLTGDVGIVRGSTAALFNTGGGGFSKTGGTGVSTIGVNVTNLNGTASQIEVASGTLDFAGTVSGAQAFTIDAGKALQFDAGVATGSAVSFAGASGALTLNDAQDFKGSIAGFGAGRSLDLHSVVFNAGLTGLAYSGTTAAGTLTVSDGTHVAKLAMLGNYAANAFHLASDSHGGSLVTYG